MKIMAEKEKTGFLHYVGQAWLVLLLSICFGAALAGVEKFTRPKIIQNEKGFIARKLVDMFGPGTTAGKELVLEVTIEGQSRPVKVPCYPAIRSGRRVGWGILATGQGYDTLTLLIGVDEAVETIRGFRVIKSLETPGIGDKIEQESFYEQFQGKAARKPLVPVDPRKSASGNEVNTITSATISSKGVVEIINKNLAAVRDKLIAAGKEMPQP